MAAPEKRRGYVGNVYRNTAVPPAQTFNQIVSAMDIKLGDAWSTFEASNRASPVKKYLPGQLDWSLEFTIIMDSTDDDITALQVAHRSGDPISLFAADGLSTTPGTSGPLCEWLVTEFGKDMPLGDGLKVSVKMVPHANCIVEPDYLVIS